MRFNITKHAKSRYEERVLAHSPSENIYKEMLISLSASTNETSKISSTFPRFILYIKERYKTNINILKNGDIIYILSKLSGTEKTYSVLTCYKDINFLDTFSKTALSNDEIHHRLKMLKK